MHSFSDNQHFGHCFSVLVVAGRVRQVVAKEANLH